MDKLFNITSVITGLAGGIAAAGNKVEDFSVLYLIFLQF